MKFSVLIPAYKSTYLRECILSVLNQTYEDYELIVVDDDSPNKIKEIVEEFHDARVNFYVNESNVGSESLVKAWNIGLKYCKGDYVLLLGDDDILNPNCLEVYEKYIKIYNADVYHCRSYIVDSNGSVLRVSQPLPLYEGFYEYATQRLENRREQYLTDFLYDRRAIIDSGGFFDLPLGWGSDDLTSYKHAEQKGIVGINEPLVRYRTSQHNVSSLGDIELKVDSIKLQEVWLRNVYNRLNAQTKLEEVYKKGFIAVLNKYVEKQKIYTFCFSITNGGQRGFVKVMKMFLCRKISFKELIYTCVWVFRKIR